MSSWWLIILDQPVGLCLPPTHTQAGDGNSKTGDVDNIIWAGQCPVRRGAGLHTPSCFWNKSELTWKSSDFLWTESCWELQSVVCCSQHFHMVSIWVIQGLINGARGGWSPEPRTPGLEKPAPSPGLLIWPPNVHHQRNHINTSFTFLITRTQRFLIEICKCSQTGTRVTHVALMSYWQRLNRWRTLQAVKLSHQKRIKSGC